MGLRCAGAVRRSVSSSRTLKARGSVVAVSPNRPSSTRWVRVSAIDITERGVVAARRTTRDDIDLLIQNAGALHADSLQV
jgi:hypothetical protein